MWVCAKTKGYLRVCKTHTRAGLYLALYTHQKEQLITTNDIAHPCSNGDIDNSAKVEDDRETSKLEGRTY